MWQCNLVETTKRRTSKTIFQILEEVGRKETTQKEIMKKIRLLLQEQLQIAVSRSKSVVL
jgi:hypothetical protein